MTKRLTVRPAPGRRVRLPGQEHVIPPGGAEVELDLFVCRRLADGDLVPVVANDAAEAGARKKKDPR